MQSEAVLQGSPVMQSESVLQDSPVMQSEMVPENNPVLQTVQLLIVNPDGTVNMTYCNDLHSLASGGMEISPLLLVK